MLTASASLNFELPGSPPPRKFFFDGEADCVLHSLLAKTASTGRNSARKKSSTGSSEGMAKPLLAVLMLLSREPKSFRVTRWF
jgi:hypothetical protein